jgi:hypothetical protein
MSDWFTHDRRRPEESDGERLADLTSKFGPINRAAVDVMLNSLGHPPIQWAASTTPEEIASSEAQTVSWRVFCQAHLDDLLDELRDLREAAAGKVVDAGPGPTATTSTTVSISGATRKDSDLTRIDPETAQVHFKPDESAEVPAKVEPKPPRRCPTCHEPMPDKACAACYIRSGGGPGHTAGGSDSGWWR